MKNDFEGRISRLDTAEERIPELEDISLESSKPKSKENKDWQNPEQNIQGLWDNYKKDNIHVNRISEEEKERETEEIFETIMTENSHKLTSDTKPQVLEAYRTTKSER